MGWSKENEVHQALDKLHQQGTDVDRLSSREIADLFGTGWNHTTVNTHRRTWKATPPNRSVSESPNVSVANAENFRQRSNDLEATVDRLTITMRDNRNVAETRLNALYIAAPASRPIARCYDGNWATADRQLRGG